MKHTQRKRKKEISMEFKDLLEKSGMNIKQFSEYFNIPYRTVQNWKIGDRKCPPYLVDLMRYKIETEKEKGNI